MADHNSKRSQEAVAIQIEFEEEPLGQALKEIGPIPMPLPVFEPHYLAMLSNVELLEILAKTAISTVQVLDHRLIIWLRDSVLTPLFVSWLYDHLVRRKILSVKVGDKEVQLDKKKLEQAIAQEMAKNRRERTRSAKRKKATRVARSRHPRP